MSRFEKLHATLKYYMLGKGYLDAVEAMYFAEKFHTGTRKDGVTPEFQHQIEIALYLITLKDVEDEQRCLKAVFLHDVMEDYDVPRSTFVEHFGEDTANDVEILSKVVNGAKKSMDVYFMEIGGNPCTSVVKGCDRIHNINTMIGVFTPEKQQKYITEVRERFIPMLKGARRIHPKQTTAYMNIEHHLVNMATAIEESFDGARS